MPDLVDETHAELGLRDSAPLAELSAADLAWLRDTVRDVRQREQAALEAAVDRAMEHVPWLVRGAVRRILFP